MSCWQYKIDQCFFFLCFLTFFKHTVQNFFLIWISRQTKNLHSPKSISYLYQSFRFAPPDKQKSEIWGNLAKVSHQFLRMEREDVIPFWKFWTVTRTSTRRLHCMQLRCFICYLHEILNLPTYLKLHYCFAIVKQLEPTYYILEDVLFWSNINP